MQHPEAACMARHKELPVKVNAFVDEGIADLVRALSDVPSLVTMESCQGGDGQDAYVFFRMEDWRQLGAFLFDTVLPAMSDDLRSATSLRVQAYDTRMARGSITIDPHAIPAMTECVRRLTSAVGARPHCKSPYWDRPRQSAVSEPAKPARKSRVKRSEP